MCNATITINKKAYGCERDAGHPGMHERISYSVEGERHSIQWGSAGDQTGLQIVDDELVADIFNLPARFEPQTLQDARHMLDRSQGDVRDEEHKRDLQTQAAVSALIAIAETTARQTELTQALLEKLGKA